MERRRARRPAARAGGGVVAAGADVVALQEVTRADAAAVARGARRGSARAPRDARSRSRRRSGRRPLGVLTAAREPLDARRAARRAVAGARPRLPARRARDAQPPLADRARARAGEDPHARGGRRLPGRASAHGPRVLCGDLNTPAPRARRRRRAHLRPRQRAAGCAPSAASAGTRAERALVHGLREHGWVDAFRALHGYGQREASWTFATTAAAGASTTCSSTASRRWPSAYAHEWRRAGPERPLGAGRRPRTLTRDGDLPPPVARPPAEGLTAVDLAASCPAPRPTTARSCS